MSRVTLTAPSLAIALAAAFALLPATAPQAQGAACRGRVHVDSVYQNGTGGNRYDYMVQIRNSTGGPLTLQLAFAGFGTNVTLFSPQLAGISLQPNASQTIRFGNGTNGNINLGSVAVVYDTAAAAGRATVAVTNCQ
ncbi:hypothetical protein [Falsiroseomonas tokyonensis]|uniref:Uncharacterized protein n=1 Tax=Falsiroseomonas tokyonensis TaxID=430521 RepID=A0ABV7C2F8_9PROT|nr:hypothetical protein [Falsiroseomonas tokyonensis]MBU8541093.1 hypothetical protein [Falsiroseomonas tokyonensis]